MRPAPAAGGVVDPALPHLTEALIPARVAEALAVSKHFAGRRAHVVTAALSRHKPGRRAVIEYTLEMDGADRGRQQVHAIGKMRASRPPRSAYRLLKALWSRGFDAASADGISVPEPLGTVPALGLWLQRRVPGQLATALLTTPAAAPLARRVADAAHKLHHAAVEPDRAHGPADEIAILARVLADVAGARPDWSTRLARVLALSRRLAAELTDDTTPIHRDFYADQIVVDGPRLYLLDFDLYCRGSAALDLGNFAGHLVEQSLRTPAAAPALTDALAALESRYVAHAGEAARRPLRIYTALTLARHIYLAGVVPGRAATAAAVLDATVTRLEALVDGRD